MSRTLDIVVVPDTFQQIGDNQVVGIVYWDAEGHEFPEKCWNDSVVVIVLWWVESLLQLLRGSEETVELRFMEGPFWVRLTRAGQAGILLQFVDGRHGRDVKYEKRESKKAVLRAIIDAAKATVGTCKSMNLLIPEVTVLNRRISQLSKLEENGVNS
ncbi:hypothetical protein LCGC14_2399930 [marine sediment metagenome]|uniref:Uncharacterized protein n=1 Tax=marine sediment metagenome TaxID=412755 RepID=A0A0F9BVR3_9ZZZZ